MAAEFTIFMTITDEIFTTVTADNMIEGLAIHLIPVFFPPIVPALATAK